MLPRCLPSERPLTGLIAGVALTLVIGCSRPGPVDDLLAADRAYSAASAKTDLITGISAMLADNVMMPLPAGKFANGPAEVTAALRNTSDSAHSRAEWTPIRAGISADGTQGFTFGFMTVHRADSSVAGMKYLAYWIKGPKGWRVVAYKRVTRADSSIVPVMLPPAIPDSTVPPSRDSVVIRQYRESLASAERGFSNEAQLFGLGRAFVKFGSPDAVNLGGPKHAGFVMGPEDIAKLVSQNEPPIGSSLSWGPDKVFVASSGDLGVTFGLIRQNVAPKDGTPVAQYAFFTIWRRKNPHDLWHYVAE